MINCSILELNLFSTLLSSRFAISRALMPWSALWLEIKSEVDLARATGNEGDEFLMNRDFSQLKITFPF